MELFDRPIEPGWSLLRNAIRAADDVGELRQIWPRDLAPSALC
jgi:hypothetical protein